ncbi:tubulin polyglutamylase complex subunit 2 isoform X1 [Nematostella vectensis]|uniref:tubulin polyglutamylase complex subunit 2 isoform X1 n=1 Tax=Nematostella vectensis TaxID=45351 RepID=UPI00139046C4|nr:tubulin polyglutamylase complex subunit 2 isoform X1 [Nematostella vectensis]
MASLSDQGKLRELFDRMTLGIVRSLEKRPGVTDVRLLDRKPAESGIIDAWEQKNMCILPDDVKSFYQTTNGLLLQWCIKFGGSVLPLGKMEINPVASLVPLTKASTTMCDNPSLADIDSDTDEQDENGHVKPHFDSRSKLFELDPCDGFGKVCLVYKDVKAGVTICKPEVWLLDRALEWSFISNTFSDYFRMMIMHLGLPLWQYIFSDAGISPETKQWFNLYAPVRLAVDAEGKSNPAPQQANEVSTVTNKLDINKLFKGKSDKHRARPPQQKKPATSRPQNVSQRLASTHSTRGITR